MEEEYFKLIINYLQIYKNLFVDFDWELQAIKSGWSKTLRLGLLFVEQKFVICVQIDGLDRW